MNHSKMLYGTSRYLLNISLCEIHGMCLADWKYPGQLWGSTEPNLVVQPGFPSVPTVKMYDCMLGSPGRPYRSVNREGNSTVGEKGTPSTFGPIGLTAPYEAYYEQARLYTCERYLLSRYKYGRGKRSSLADRIFSLNFTDSFVEE